MDTGAEKIGSRGSDNYRHAEAEIHMSLKLADFDAEHSMSISQLYTTKSGRSFESILIYVSADKTGWGVPQRNPVAAISVRLEGRIVRSESVRRVRKLERGRLNE